MIAHPSSDLIDAAARTLAEAFAEDTFFVAIMADYPVGGIERRSRMETYFRYAIVEGQQYGIIVLLDDGTGAAVWLKPQPPEIEAQMTAAKTGFLTGLLGPRGMAAYTGIVSAMIAPAAAVTTPGSWYLSLLGVATAVRGTGRAHRLLRPTLDEADRLGMPCFVETFTPGNVTLYTHFGFIEAASYIEPTVGQRAWVLVRPPAVIP